MGKYNELTPAAILERLMSPSVPHRKNDDDFEEYYLWVVTDKNLEKVLTDAQFGNFKDMADSLGSVTMPPERANGYWLFAPTDALIEWFKDNEVSEHLKLAYLKLSRVEEHFDQDEYPPTLPLTRADGKLYAYVYPQIKAVNETLLTAFDQGSPESEAFDKADESVFGRQDEFEPEESQVDDQVDDFELEELEDPLMDGEDAVMPTDEYFDSAEEEAVGFVDEDEMDYPGDDGPSEGFVTEPGESTGFFAEPDLSVSAEESAELAELLAAYKPLSLKAPLIQIDAGSAAYRQKVASVREQINQQLGRLVEEAKQETEEAYHKDHQLAEKAIAKRLDEKTGDDEIVMAWQKIQDLKTKELAKLDEASKQKQTELEEQVDSKKDAYIQEAMRKAEVEWESIKTKRFVEEPVKEWRAKYEAQIEDRAKARQDKFEKFRQTIRTEYLAQEDASIKQKLQAEVQAKLADLREERENAKEELSRLERQLFEEDLKQSRPANVPTETVETVTDEVSDVEPEIEDDESDFEPLVEDESLAEDEDDGVDTDDSEDAEEIEEFEEEEDDLTEAPVEEEPAPVAKSDEDLDELSDLKDFDFDDVEDEETAGTDTAMSEPTTEEATVDMSLFDDEDEDENQDVKLNELNDFEDDEEDEDLDEDLDEEVKEKKKSSTLDRYLDEGDDDITEKNVVEHVLNEDEEDDDDKAVEKKKGLRLPKMPKLMRSKKQKDE